MIKPTGTKWSAAALSIAFVSLVACASSTRSPQHAGGRSETNDGIEGEEDGETADNDGDAEASSSELAITSTEPGSGPCPTNMVLITSESPDAARFCIDKYEASLVETDAEGNERPFPHWLPVDGKTVRAVSVPDVFPQGFISEVQADDACVASGKRLCGYAEWKTACVGPSKTTFPYGNTRQAGVCHDTGKSAVAAVFGVQRLADPVAASPPSRPTSAALPTASKPSSSSAKNNPGAKPTQKAHAATKGRAAETSHRRPSRSASASSTAKKPASSSQRSPREGGSRLSSAAAKKSPGKRAVTPAKASARPASVEPSVWTQLNDPRLGQVDGALSKTGAHAQCVNGFGVVDMVGNLHEWVKTDASLAHGTFAGGYYLDTSINGDGCQYKTQAHAHDYHDYSTGFRCCADAKPDGQGP